MCDVVLSTTKVLIIVSRLDASFCNNMVGEFSEILLILAPSPLPFCIISKAVVTLELLVSLITDPVDSVCVRFNCPSSRVMLFAPDVLLLYAPCKSVTPDAPTPNEPGNIRIITSSSTSNGSLNVILLLLLST